MTNVEFFPADKARQLNEFQKFEQECRLAVIRAFYLRSMMRPAAIMNTPRRRSKSDDIGMDHDVACIELPDRYMRGGPIT